MDGVGHEDEVMQAGLEKIMLQSCKEETGPSLVAEEALAAGCLEGGEVGLVGLPEEFSAGAHPFPLGLKPLYFGWLTAGLKPRPFKARAQAQ
jgi:hypothetical protein